ncbi:MAG: methionine synthase [Treponema sp.]|nr:methionine synthase [Treponema sp.]
MIDTAQQITALLKERILILDGAMGSLLQERAPSFSFSPDLFCLEKPELVSAIHQEYLEAGADIITTCSFNANALSLADYGLAEKTRELCRVSAVLARQAADNFTSAKKPRFVAGSMGPTSRSAAIAPDVEDPSKRGVSWDELEAAYHESAGGLMEGGADLLMLETVFDTLNAKAAIAAVRRLIEETGRGIPLMISATISDASGRLLAGQTLEAFVVSVLHARPFSLGLNCSLGAEKLLPHLRELAACAPAATSCHPNAGLPNSSGGYDEKPEETAAFIRAFLDQGLVNIVGGCCGTTPDHIAKIAELARSYPPRPLAENGAFGAAVTKSMLAGLEALDLDKGFVDIGERCNVAGSKKFLRLVQRGFWDQALDIARAMIDAGAGIIDICMDDALLDGKAAMTRFLALALSDPYIARVPIMIDSSRWEILEAALKCIQGKALVNSISLKEGEAEFLRRAKLIHHYGAAAVVMLFDEQGQAQNYGRKIEIAGRSFKLLLASGFPPEDIVFDPNVLTIATGMAEHDPYALDFIRAAAWIREHCPRAHVSAGVSNLSFSFRGNETVRRALHAVFLENAVKAGLDMAIVNPANLVSAAELPAELREAAEDAVLCRGENPSEKIISLALRKKENEAGAAPSSVPAWRTLPPEERLAHALVQGIDSFIEDDVLALKQSLSALALVEGPLMRGMETVGKFFGEGKLFLPQVIRSARVMKKAVAVLEPFLVDEKEADADSRPAARAKIVLATVKGDVHDIGKNITALVLSCNGFEVIDLGVMVPSEKILDTARELGADFIGLSGLISPSLEEMVKLARAMEERGFDIPLLVGGAAASTAHTALRIAPVYSGPVVYVSDAGKSAAVLRNLLSSAAREKFLTALAADYEKASALHREIEHKRSFLALEEARANRPPIDWTDIAARESAVIQYDDYPLDSVAPLLNWNEFCAAWELKKPDAASERKKLIDDASALLKKIVSEKLLTLKAVTGFFPAVSQNEDVIVLDGSRRDQNGETVLPERARFCFLRNQQPRAAAAGRQKNTAYNLCLADFILPQSLRGAGGAPRNDWLGLFAVSAGFGLDTAAAPYREAGDDYGALLIASLSDHLAEAFAEKLHRETSGGGIRPAFGYAACPDHEDKRLCFSLLEAERRIGLTLTDSAMIRPAASICGMYFTHPDSRYFAVGKIDAGQLADWARRKGITVDEARRRAGFI